MSLSIALTLALVVAAPPIGFGDSVDTAALAAVHARLAALGRPMAVMIQPGEHAWPVDAHVVDAKANGPFPRARVPVTVRLNYQGSTRTAIVWATLSDRQRVATYAANYQRGTEADRVATHHAVVDLVGYSGALQEAVPTSLVLVHGVTAGDPVLAEDFAEAPAIRVGDRLDVAASAGPVTLHSPAWALESGAAGDRIQVRMDAPSRAVAVRIIGKGRVAVDE